MNRLAGFAIVLASVVPAVAGNPLPGQVPPYPRPINQADVTAPLSTAMAAAPIAYPDAGNPNCADGSCGASGCRPSRPLLGKLCDWLLFQPGPRCAPTFVPTPYKAPVWSYFHCRSDCLCLVGGCQTGCANGSCGPRLRGHGLASRGMIGERLADSGTCRDTFLSRLFGRSHCKYGAPSGCWPGTEFTVPAAGYQAWGGSSMTPVLGAPAWSNGTGARFANPTAVPTTSQQTAYRPFTNP